MTEHDSISHFPSLLYTFIPVAALANLDLVIGLFNQYHGAAGAGLPQAGLSCYSS